jgi:hypothetical protein
MTSDRSYDSGVTMNSVCDMVDDMYRCISGRSAHIKMPVPLNGSGPSMYMNFIDSNSTYVSDLSPRRKRSAGTDKVRTSMVSRARFTVVPYANQSMVDVNPMHDTTLQAVDDLIREMSVQDNVSEHIIDDRASSSSRTFMSDTSINEGNGVKEDNEENREDGEDAEDGMEDLDDDGLPIEAEGVYARPKPVLKRIESIIVPDRHYMQEVRIGAPASRFARRV